MLDIKPVHGTRRIVYVCMCTVAKENVDLVAARENKKGQLKVPILQRELSLRIYSYLLEFCIIYYLVDSSCHAVR